ncbi:FHA domain-containing protein [Leucobacter komagatae]|nr:FHA domain-containing protein [Leucobacter komagatae]
MPNDMGFGGFGGPILAVIGIWSVVGLGVYVWYLWALARLFPYLGLPAAHGWIPIWNQWRLIERGGLPGWTAVLGIIPGLQLVTYVMSVIAIHRINQEHEETTGMTVLGALLAPMWATLLGSRLQDRGYAAGAGTRQAESWRPHAGGLVEYGPDGQVYPLLPGAAPHQRQQHTAMPPVPQGFGSQQAQPTHPQQASPTGPLPTPAPHPAATPLSPGDHPTPGPVPAAPPFPSTPTAGVPQNNPWGLGKTTEGNFQRLANEQQPSRDPSFGSSFDARPFSWPQPAPIPPEAPLLPEPQAPATSAENAAAAAANDAWTPSAQAVEAAVGAAAAAEPEPAPAIPQAVAETRVTAAEVAPVLPPLAPPVHPSVQPPAASVAGPADGAAAAAILEPEPVPAPTPLPEPVSLPEPAPVPNPASQPEPMAAPAAVVPPEASTSAAPVASLASRAESQLSEPAPLDDDFDETVVVSRRVRWAIQLPDGQQLELASDDVVVGRKPVAVEGSEVLLVPDATRTLSKSHARLRLTGDDWTIEDLHSTNGVFTIDAAGEQRELAPGVPVAATRELIIGTLEVRLVTLD